MEGTTTGLDDVSVKEFQTVIDDWLDTRKAIDDIEASIKPLSAKRAELEQKIMAMFEATGLEKFQGTKGSVQKRVVEYANNPAEESREAFITYLIESGELSDVITFHQGRLTSWYKAKKEELGFDFKPPGLDDLKQRIEIRKGK